MTNKLSWTKALGAVLLVTAIFLVFYEQNKKSREATDDGRTTVRKNEVSNSNSDRSGKGEKQNRERVLEKEPDLPVYAMFTELEGFKELEARAERGENVRLEVVKEGTFAPGEGTPRLIKESLPPEYFESIEKTFVRRRQAKNPVEIETWLEERELLRETWNVKSIDDTPYFGAENDKYFVYCAKHYEEMDIGLVVFKNDGRVMSFDISQK